jgi:hypothetical protein
MSIRAGPEGQSSKKYCFSGHITMAKKKKSNPIDWSRHAGVAISEWSIDDIIDFGTLADWQGVLEAALADSATESHVRNVALYRAVRAEHLDRYIMWQAIPDEQSTADRRRILLTKWRSIDSRAR